MSNPAEFPRLLVWDVGNTHIVLAFMRGAQVVHSWRLQTDLQKTTDEYEVLVRGILFAYKFINLDEIQGAVLCSVVPGLSASLAEVCLRLLGQPPLLVSHRLHTGLTILADPPEKVGADRLANAVAVFQEFQQAAIIADLGTATTLDVLSAAGEFQGGMICPGMKIAAEALFARTSQLLRVPLERPPQVIGTNTIDCLKSGIFYGYADMMNGLIQRLKHTMLQAGSPPPLVVVTGGLANVLQGEWIGVDHWHPDLTLQGLRRLYEMNCG